MKLREPVGRHRGPPTRAEIVDAAALLTTWSPLSSDPPVHHTYSATDYDPDSPKWRLAIQTVRLTRARG